MGLDMYLSAKRFLWYSEDDLSNKIAENFPGLGDKRIKEVTAEAAYWRKANAIHNWFVENVQGGTDDCGNYEVSREQLQELLDLIEKVLADRGTAKDALPTANGFFFGNTDYDDWYFSDLEHTRDMLKDCLDDKWKGWDFEYHSSW
jgi:hypothetical protein